MIFRSRNHGFSLSRGDGKKAIHFTPHREGFGELSTDDAAVIEFIRNHDAFRVGLITEVSAPLPAPAAKRRFWPW